MKWSELKGKTVVSIAGANRLGHIDDLFLDAAGQQALGFRVRSGGLITHRQAMLLRNVESAEGDAITVKDASRLNQEDTFSELQGSIPVETLTGSKVLTQSGNELGKLSDIEIGLPEGVVTHYYLGTGLLGRIRGEEHALPASAVTSLGESFVIVRDDASPDQD